MFTLLVSATARSVSPEREEMSAVSSVVGQLVSATSTEFEAIVSTSMAMRGGGWRGIVAATTMVGISEAWVDL